MSTKLGKDYLEYAASGQDLLKEVKKKKQAEKRLMTKAAANLTQDQLLQVLAIKAAAKSKAKAKAKGKA